MNPCSKVDKMLGKSRQTCYIYEPGLYSYILTDFNSGTRGLQTKCRAYTDGSQDWDSNWKKLERFLQRQRRSSSSFEVFFAGETLL